MKKEQLRMRKSFFLVLTLLFSLVLAVGVQGLSSPLCSGNIDVFQNCSVLVSLQGCSTFTLYNDSATVVESGTLLNWSADNATQYFNFTHSQKQGDFWVQYCDNSTALLSVGGSGMDSSIFVLLPFLVSAIMLGIVFTMDNKTHEFIRYVIGMFSFITTLFGVWFAFIINIDFFGSSSLEDALSTYLWVMISLIFAVMLYVILYIFIRQLRMVAERKQKDLEY